MHTLLLAVGRGDTSAFSDLYDRTAAQILGMVTAAHPGLATAADVCERIFLQVWRLAPRFDPTNETAAAFILRIAATALAR